MRAVGREAPMASCGRSRGSSWKTRRSPTMTERPGSPGGRAAVVPPGALLRQAARGGADRDRPGVYPGARDVGPYRCAGAGGRRGVPAVDPGAVAVGAVQ
ncbi:hypothetical protein GCM10009753_11960 [Streptantibioticus ferralitis]